MDGTEAVMIRQANHKIPITTRRQRLLCTTLATVLSIILGVGLGPICEAWAATPPAVPSDSADSVGPDLGTSASAQPMEKIAVESQPQEMPLAETAPTTNQLPAPPKAAPTTNGESTPVALPKATATSGQNAAPAKPSEPEHNDRLEQIARQADQQLRHGFELADRKAYYAARASFVGALRLVAEGLDTEQKTNSHVQALAAAMTAMREAEDFLPSESRPEATINLNRLIAAHTTPVLKQQTAEAITPMAATKRYFTYAQEQFSDATGREVAGSMALYALGKLHGTLAQKKSSLEAAAESKAIVFYQAAMLSCPTNHMAANDLGVLLARYGRYQEARSMLEYSVACHRMSVTWHNLSVVYQRLGQSALAQNANQQALAFQQTETARRRAVVGSGNGMVRWVDTQTFAASSANAPNSPYAYSRPPMQAARPSAEPGRLPTDAPPGATIGSATARSQTPTRPSMRYATPPSSAERMSWGSGTYQR